MKEIKYRAWDKKNKRWVDNDVVLLPNGRVDVVDLDSEVNSKDVEIVLFTGFKDENNIKIFEGDILELDNLPDIKKNYEVIFEDGKFTGGGMDLKLSLELCGAKVIGNIYENPELLNGGNENGK